MKLLIVGLDAADHLWVKKFWSSMPNLRKLAERGSFGMLLSTEFPTTPQAWCSLYTGCMPKEHGISGFRSDGIGPIRMRPFWEHITGWNIGLVNLPLVSAANTKIGKRGFVVPGFSAPRKWQPANWAQSNYVIETTNHQRGRARWLFGASERLVKGVKEAQIKFLRFNREAELARVDLALKFCKRQRVTVLFVGLMLIDRIGHAFAHHRDTMEDTYRTADGLLGRLIEGTKPEFVIVFSDHGLDLLESDRVPETVKQNEDRRRKKHPDKLRARGNHTREGIVCFAGDGIARFSLEDAELRDIAPTLLWMINGEVPESMSGKVLSACSNGLSELDEQRLSETLAALGYT